MEYKKNARRTNEQTMQIIKTCCMIDMTHEKQHFKHDYQGEQ